MQTALVRRVFALGLLCFLAGGLLACDFEPGGSSTIGADPDGPTIVSLTPAITRMLIDMGKGGQIIGVAEHDDASMGLPVCGSYNKPVIARIVALKPDLVLTESPMGQLGDVPALLRRLSDEGVFELRVIPHSRSIADVRQALIDPGEGLGVAVGDLPAASRAEKLMQLRIELIHGVVKDAKPPRTLMLINPTTLGAIGTGVTHHELLQLAGGVNALAHVDTGYLTLDRAQLQQSVRPEVVLIFEPGGSELSDADVRLRAFEGLAIPVNTTRRFAVVDHPNAMLPSTALPEVMLEMALALHPAKAAAIREAYDTAEQVIQQAESADKDGS